MFLLPANDSFVSTDCVLLVDMRILDTELEIGHCSLVLTSVNSSRYIVMCILCTHARACITIPCWGAPFPTVPGPRKLCLSTARDAHTSQTIQALWINRAEAGYGWSCVSAPLNILLLLGSTVKLLTTWSVDYLEYLGRNLCKVKPLLRLLM